MRVLVTGATGFVGAHVARELDARGHAVRAFVRDPARAEAVKAHLTELVRGDLADPETLAVACGGVDAVVHVAGLTKAARDDDFTRVNVHGAAMIAGAFRQASRGRGRFVLVSSLAAAGPSPPERARREDEAPAPVSLYGASKLAGERAVAMTLAGSEVELAVVRPPIVYGEGDRDVLLAFRQVAGGWFLAVGGRAALAKRYSIVHVADLAKGIALALEAPRAAGATCFLPGPDDPAFDELLAAIERALGKRARRVPVPYALAAPGAWLAHASARLRGRASFASVDKLREARASSWRCDGALARERLGYAPSIALDEGIARTAAWYRAQGWLR